MPPRKKVAEKSSGLATTGATSCTDNSASPALRNSKLVTHVKNVFKDKINPEQEARNKAILKNFLENLIPAMKEQDKYFASLFQKLYYTGSYYENLRISDPNEFDINLVLKLPFKADVRDIEFITGVKSFVKYKLITQRESNAVLEQNKDLIHTLFEGEYLSPYKVRHWMQAVVDRALHSVSLPPGVKRIIPSASGPAKTIKLETNYKYYIDIDLVPVLQFCYPEWPKDARDNMLKTFQMKNEDKFWFLVPKEFSADGTYVNVIDSKRLWRIHFPEIEKKIIHNRGYVKPLIKLLKALRNKENWCILASYYLKTVILWLVESNPSPEYWKEDHCYIRLIEVLETLKECVSKKVIQYYFYPTFNLIQKIGPDEANKISNRLGKIIKDIKTNPEKIEIYFQF